METQNDRSKVRFVKTPRLLARRTVLLGLSAATGLTLVGCGSERAANSQAPAADKLLQPAAMTVYRDATCGCCAAWAELARGAGYQVKLVDHPDMLAIKRQHGVPDELASCHTAVVGGYAIEGHVPLSAVARLLEDRPGGTRGIAVPGMPRGSPGMETPDGAQDSFQIMAFDSAGNATVYNG